MKKVIIFAALGAVVLFSAFKSEEIVKISKGVISLAEVPFNIPEEIDLKDPHSTTELGIKAADFFFNTGCEMWVRTDFRSDPLLDPLKIEKPSSWTIETVRKHITDYKSVFVDDNVTEIEIRTVSGSLDYKLTRNEQLQLKEYYSILVNESKKATSLEDLYSRVLKHASKKDLAQVNSQFKQFRKAAGI